MRSASALLVGLWLGSACLVACEDKPKTQPKAEVDAGPVGRPVDPNLAKAVAAASANMPVAAATNGPPPTGVFPPGEAEKRLGKTGLPGVELGNEGSGTKINLAEAMLPKPGAKQTLQVQLSFQPGPRVPPVITSFELAFEALKPKAPAGEAAKAEEGAAPSAPQPVDVVVKFTKVSPGPGVVGELAKRLGELKGTKISYQLAANGGAMGMTLELPKNASLDVEDLARGVAENLMVGLIAYPTKPVGEGAVWMASSRDPHQGVDGVAYRMVKLSGLEGDGGPGTKFELEINSKFYAADSSIKRPGIPAGVNPVVQQFRSEGQGVIGIEIGKLAPTGFSTISTAIMMIDSADPTKQLSMQGATQLALGEKGMVMAKALEQARAQAAAAAAAQQQMGGGVPPSGMPQGMPADMGDDEIPE